MENQPTKDKKQEQKPKDDFQKVLKGEPLGDVLKEWATKKE